MTALTQNKQAQNELTQDKLGQDMLDKRIMAALESATDLPENPEPDLTEEIIETFSGRHSFLMKWAAFKAVAAALMICFCIYQFFQQDSNMAMIAYASATILCAVAYAAVFLVFWIQMNHNRTVREIKRVELQLALLFSEIGRAPSKPAAGKTTES